jgi:hypothetical protein
MFLDKEHRQDTINRNDSDPDFPLHQHERFFITFVRESIFRADKLPSATKKWQAREISDASSLESTKECGC